MGLGGDTLHLHEYAVLLYPIAVTNLTRHGSPRDRQPPSPPAQPFTLMIRRNVKFILGRSQVGSFGERVYRSAKQSVYELSQVLPLSVRYSRVSMRPSSTMTSFSGLPSISRLLCGTRSKLIVPWVRALGKYALNSVRSGGGTAGCGGVAAFISRMYSHLCGLGRPACFHASPFTVH